ncbi:ATP-dependent translocase ABCB1, partial [Lamellibrachia satsuma]
MADWLDKLLMLVGVLAAILHGAAMPVAVLIFSQSIDFFVADSIAKKQIMLTHSSNVSNTTTFPYLEDITTIIQPLCVRLTYWAVIIIVAGTTHMFCWKMTSERQVSRLRAQLFSAILHQDCVWFDSHDSGSLTVTLSNDIVNVNCGMSDKVCLFIQHLSVFAVSVVMALVTNWRLTLAVLALLPLLTASIIGAVLITVKMTAEQGKAYEKAGSIAKEVISSIRTVAAFGGESKDAIRYQECLLSARKTGIIMGTLIGLFFGGLWFCNFSTIGLANWYGTSLVVSDTGTSGGIVIFVMMVILSGSVALGQCLPNLEGIATAGGSAQAIFEVIDTKPQIDSNSDNGLKPDHLLGNIELKNVDFVYESRPEIKVLDQVSLKMEVGQTIALVGSSGSGKSTICHLLLRLYDSTVGQLTIDGYDIKDINVKWLRQAISVVSQEPVLFDGSISDNIRLGREGATPTEIEDAAKMANAHNFIMMFPD